MIAALRVQLGEGSCTPYLPLAEVAPLVRREVQIDPNDLYTELGVRSFNKGTFHRRRIQGAVFNWQNLYRIHAGDLVFSNIMAWEGAVALAGAADDGCVGNHRMLTCECDGQLVVPSFIAEYFKTAEGMSKLVAASTGTVARNRTLTATALSKITVPVPPVAQQQSIVARLGALAEKSRQVEAHLDAVERISSELLLSLHNRLAISRVVRLGDVLELSEISEPVTASGVYPQVGVRGFGGGLFPKPAISGTETSYKAFNRLYAGAIVLSQVKGWEGAIARCPAQLDGWFVSPEYRTFRCNPDMASGEYVGELVRTEWFWTKLQEATHGVGARRERTRPEQFLNIELPLPVLADQLRIVEILDRQLPLRAKHAAIRQANAALIPATLERIFSTGVPANG